MDTTSLRTGFTLEPGTALTLPRHARGAMLVVLRGRVWLTESGGLDDHFIEAGQQHHVQSRGAVVIECDSVEPAQWRLAPLTKAGRLPVVAITLPSLKREQRTPLVQR
ncbi:MAG: hypothetical protein JWP52_3962 [Rhizobacter sp.]|jgi:ferric-dicitrate binding protein FerR (iron transport regulator)|nr:hypothetical protein [Rhizobacter sp.]